MFESSDVIPIMTNNFSDSIIRGAEVCLCNAYRIFCFIIRGTEVCLCNAYRIFCYN